MEALTPFKSDGEAGAFCKSKCVNKTCFRRLTKADLARAKETNFHIEFADYSKGCTGYQEGRDV